MRDAIINVGFSDARGLLEPCDVLLFRGRSPLSRMISGYTGSFYTHAAVADKFPLDDTPNYCEILQFREGKGGVISSLWREVEKYSGRIDVYRPEKTTSLYRFNPETKEITTEKIEFSPNRVLMAMRKLSGLQYGYWRIFLFWLRVAPFVRIFRIKKRPLFWKVDEIKLPVCSTSVAWAFAKTGYFLTAQDPNWTTPGDLGRSPRLSYLFTLVADAPPKRA